MATSFSSQDLARIRAQYLSPGREDLVGLYTFMGSSGYAYATLALGVVNDLASEGRVANAFMAENAARQGVSLSSQDIASIKLGMANAWMQVLQVKADRQAVSADLSFAETEKFHTNVFLANSLSPETWTLYLPGKVFGEMNAELMWQDILGAVSKSGIAKLPANLDLIANMATCEVRCTDPQAKAEAKDWIDLFFPSGYRDVPNVAKILGDLLGTSDKYLQGLTLDPISFHPNTDVTPNELEQFLGWEHAVLQASEESPLAMQALINDQTRALAVFNDYKIYLGRDPDAGGFDWFMHNGMTLDQIHDAFINSSEHRTYFIKTMYQDLVGRDATDDAISWFMTNGMSFDQMRTCLMDSSEYLQREEIKSVYHSKLDRAPSEAELDDQMWFHTSLDQIGQDLAASPEHQILVQRIYQDLVGRDPGEGAQEWYSTNGMSVAQIRQCVMDSSEYQLREVIKTIYQAEIGRSPTEIELDTQIGQRRSVEQIGRELDATPEHRTFQIAQMYHELLERDSDAGGLQYWDHSSLSIQQIRENFIGSAEYQALHPHSGRASNMSSDAQLSPTADPPGTPDLPVLVPIIDVPVPLGPALPVPQLPNVPFTDDASFMGADPFSGLTYWINWLRQSGSQGGFDGPSTPGVIPPIPQPPVYDPPVVNTPMLEFSNPSPYGIIPDLMW